MTVPHNRSRRLAPPSPQGTPYTAPHAALLIDFDNVTMGIRSDLTKELKTLLNSEIIRGKVTVQRAYADWRRYSQYVMPLTERSIDMIWATAVGATKKNATDIRLAIDAIELVFTRPEIGTFIVLSGDSDFSSLVLKLKEYGKYVIGIGIRESASDLLIQNCDEYYSYSELAGLHREVDAPNVQRDPWELVSEAVEQMVRQGDVLRSDRLKQVMQQIDPNFDERNAGFSRFSKFVTEAASRGLITVTKLENGQYEVSPGEGRAVTPVAEPAAERDGERRGRGRGRGGRDRDRERRDPDKERSPRSEREAAPQAGGEQRRKPAASDTPLPVAPPNGQLSLGGAFQLLTKALGELPNPVRHDVVRARMAALHGREDPLLETERFARFLRQANDAEYAEVKKLGDDGFEVSLTRSSRARLGPAVIGSAAAPAPDPSATGDSPAREERSATDAPPAEVNGARTAMLRFRRGSRGPIRPPAIPTVGMVEVEVAPVVAAPVAAVEPVAEAAAPAEPKKPAAKRGGRGRTAKTAKPAPAVKAERAAKPAAPASTPAATPAAADAKPAAKSRARRGRGRTAKKAS
ncbi:MAG: NYN domain-containing protein [Gemmatimonadales bacterium]